MRDNTVDNRKTPFVYTHKHANDQLIIKKDQCPFQGAVNTLNEADISTGSLLQPTLQVIYHRERYRDRAERVTTSTSLNRLVWVKAVGGNFTKVTESGWVSDQVEPLSTRHTQIKLTSYMSIYIFIFIYTSNRGSLGWGMDYAEEFERAD